jgi:hypothetical protein
MAEKLNITFVKGTRRKFTDPLSFDSLQSGQMMINGEGPLYYMSETNSFVINNIFVSQARRLIAKKRGKK